jgi:uncharacterized protein (DUF58 family)
MFWDLWNFGRKGIVVGESLWRPPSLDPCLRKHDCSCKAAPLWQNYIMTATTDTDTPLPTPATSKASIRLRLRLPILWLIFLLLGAVLLPDKVWNTLLVGFGGLFIVAYFWVWQLSRGLHAGRRLRFGWVAVGDRLGEEFMITNNADVPALWVEIVDESNVPGYRAAVVRSVSARNVDRWRESAVCLRRGQFQLGPWAIRSSDPFGIFTITRRYPQSQEIIIHPPVHGQLPIPLPLGDSSGQVRARQRSWQATVNAAAVRDYYPQDPLRWIHWPTSARRGKLFVRQFDLDAAGDIWILVDLHTGVQLGREAQSTEEHAVLLAASLAARALRHNRAVGLAAYSLKPYILPPARGQGQQWKILRALALVNTDGQTALADAMHDLSRVAQKGAAAIVITADGSADWLPELVTLAKKGVQSHITLLDRSSFGGQGNSSAVQNAVRQLGFTASIIRRGEVGQPLEEQERRGFWEFKVTGMGKVIAVASPESASLRKKDGSGQRP